MRPTPRRPAHSRRLRLSRRLAAGFSPAQAAQAEGVPAAEVDALLAEPAFAALVAAFRDLEALPEDEQRRRLTGLARCTLELALADGDARVALFVMREEGRGRDPARTVADGLIAAGRRARAAAEPASEPAAAPATVPVPPARRRPAHPADRLVWRVAARLRATVAREHAARFGGTSTPAPAQPAKLPDTGRAASSGIAGRTPRPDPAEAPGARDQSRPGAPILSPPPKLSARSFRSRLAAGTALGPSSSLGSPTAHVAVATSSRHCSRPPPPS